MTPSDRFARVSSIRQRALEDDVVLYNPRTDAVSSLDSIGSLVWELLDEPATAEELAAGLSERFGAEPDDVTADLLALFGALLASGLIERV
jgi:PqqD family protein of HPr-rel-A system